jgi:hypothetical protein
MVTCPRLLLFHRRGGVWVFRQRRQRQRELRGKQLQQLRRIERRRGEQLRDHVGKQ